MENTVYYYEVIFLKSRTEDSHIFKVNLLEVSTEASLTVSKNTIADHQL